MHNSNNHGKRKADSDAGAESSKRHKDGSQVSATVRTLGEPNGIEERDDFGEDNESRAGLPVAHEHKPVHSAASMELVLSKLQESDSELKSVKEELQDIKAGYKKLEETLRDAWREQGRLERERDDAQERDDELGDLKEELTKANDDRATIRSLLSGMGINDIELLEAMLVIDRLRMHLTSRDGDFLALEVPLNERKKSKQPCWFAKRVGVDPKTSGLRVEYFIEHIANPGTYVFWGKGSCEFHNILVSTQRLPESTQERDWLFTFLKLAFPNKVYTEAVGPTRAE